MSVKKVVKKHYYKTSFRATAGVLVVVFFITMVLHSATIVAISRSEDKSQAAVNYLADSTEYVNKNSPQRVMDYLQTLGNPKTLADHYQLASTQIAREEYSDALANIEKCIALHNNEGHELYMDLLLKRSCLQVMLGKYDAALQSLDQALAEDPTAADIYLIKGQIYAERQNMGALSDCLTAYLKLVPGDNSIRELLAQAQFTEGNYAAAAQQYEEILATESKAEIEYLSGLNAVKNADFKKGEAFLTKAIGKDDNFEGIYYYRGVCWMSLENYPAAIEDLTVSIARKDMQQASFYTRGVCLLMNNEYEKGLTDVQTAAAGDEDDEITQQAKLLIAELEAAQAQAVEAEDAVPPLAIETPAATLLSETQPDLEQEELN